MKKLSPSIDLRSMEISDVFKGDNIVTYARYLMLAATIVKTMETSEANKVCIFYGSNHWFTLEDFLEYHFGKPEEMSYQDYFSKRKKSGVAKS